MECDIWNERVWDLPVLANAFGTFRRIGVSAFSGYFASAEYLPEQPQEEKGHENLQSGQNIPEMPETTGTDDLSISGSLNGVQADDDMQCATETSGQMPFTTAAPPPRGLNMDLTNLNSAILDVGEIKNNAKKVNASSIERVSFIESLIDHAETVNANVGKLGEKNHQSQSSIEQVTTGIAEISENVVNLSEDFAISVKGLQEMTDLANGFQKKFEGVKVACQSIDELSSTIKMVALNASIEAARNGEAGQGFSLIASEIRELSDRSRQDIENIFEAVQTVGVSFTTLVASIENISKNMTDNYQTSQQFKEHALNLCNDSRELSHRMLDVSRLTTAQLPTVSGLVEDIRQIKANTEAAVSGSQNNINLCTRALEKLDTVLEDDAGRRKLSA